MIDKLNQSKQNTPEYDLAHQKFIKDYINRSGSMGIHFVLTVNNFIKVLVSLTLFGGNLMDLSYIDEIWVNFLSTWENILYERAEHFQENV